MKLNMTVGLQQSKTRAFDHEDRGILIRKNLWKKKNFKKSFKKQYANPVFEVFEVHCRDDNTIIKLTLKFEEMEIIIDKQYFSDLVDIADDIIQLVAIHYSDIVFKTLSNKNSQED